MIFMPHKKLEPHKNEVCKNKDFYSFQYLQKTLKYQNLINIQNLEKHHS